MRQISYSKKMQNYINNVGYFIRSQLLNDYVIQQRYLPIKSSKSQFQYINSIVQISKGTESETIKSCNDVQNN